MRREWEPEELIACWTLTDADWRLVAKQERSDAAGIIRGIVEVLRASSRCTTPDHTSAELAELFSVARSTVYRAIQRAG